MPTNLPPDYFEVEKLYRQAETNEEKIAYLEQMLSIIPKHKGTDHLRADLRRRLSKLKTATEARKSSGRQTSVYHIEREGAGQVVVIGHANVGKSALVNTLTSAEPEVSPAPFSTWTPTPGMMLIEDVQVQIIDTPPLNRDFIEPLQMDLIRRSNMILLMVDLQANTIQQLEETLATLEERRIIPKDLEAKYAGQRGFFFVPLIVVVNKVDNPKLEEDFDILCELMGDVCQMLPISVESGYNLSSLKQAVFNELEIMRIYSKIPGEDPDLSIPFVMKKGSTVEEFASKIHQDFARKLKMARVWGHGVFEGQMVGRDHVLHDGDVIELRI
jgi:small GTP-binding protein